MTSSLYTYRGMPLNKIIATNPLDNAPGITIEKTNPLATHFSEATTYNFLTTTAVNVRQNLTNVIYTAPNLSSLAGRNYSAYYDVYTAETQPSTNQTVTRTYSINLTDAIACFSRIIVILIGGSGAGFPDPNNTGLNNGSSGGCVIYQINLSQMGGNNNIQIVVGGNSTSPGVRAGDTILNWNLDRGIQEMAKAGGGQSANSGGSGIGGSATINVSILPYIANSGFDSAGLRGNDSNNVYTINGYKSLLGVNATTNVIDNTTWPIFYENPNCYGGTQAPYTTANPNPIPYSGYARVYYML